MSIEALGVDLGPVDEQGNFYFDQERLARDLALTQRVQDGYTPPRDDKRTRIIDGRLELDAQIALGELWEAYIPLAKKVANSKSDRIRTIPTIEFDDLVNEAYFGLYHASLRWHPDKQITFLTQAGVMMNSYMNRYIQDKKSTVRAPSHVRDSISRVNNTTWNIYQATRQMPTRERVADAMDLPKDTVDETVAAEAVCDQMGSLDNGFFEDDRDRKSTYDRYHAAMMHSIIPGATEAETVEAQFMLLDLAEVVRKAFHDDPKIDINEREKHILFRRFLDPDGVLGLQEIGDELGVSRERVRQIEAKLLARFRHPYASAHVKEYLEY